MPSSDRHLPAKESLGSHQLQRCGKTQGELQELFSVAPREISRWLSGVRRPGLKRRRAIEKELGIPADAWDQDAPDQPEVEATTASSSATEQADRMRRLIDNQLASLEAGGSSPEQTVKLMKSLGGTISDLGKLTGESLAITEAKILRSPAWRRIQSAIVEALEPHPEILDEVLEAITNLVTERPPEVGGDSDGP